MADDVTPLATGARVAAADQDCNAVMHSITHSYLGVLAANRDCHAVIDRLRVRFGLTTDEIKQMFKEERDKDGQKTGNES